MKISSQPILNTKNSTTAQTFQKQASQQKKPSKENAPSLLAEVLATFDASHEVDQEKVEHIKLALSKGELKLDIKQLSRAMFDFHKQ